MEKKDLKVYVLKTGTVIVGKFNKVMNFIEDVLSIQIGKAVNPQTGQVGAFQVCVPIAHPFNTQPKDFDIDDLDILFEIEDPDVSIIETYEEDLDKILHPSIIQPKSAILGG